MERAEAPEHRDAAQPLHVLGASHERLPPSVKALFEAVRPQPRVQADAQSLLERSARQLSELLLAFEQPLAQPTQCNGALLQQLLSDGTTKAKALDPPAGFDEKRSHLLNPLLTGRLGLA